LWEASQKYDGFYWFGIVRKASRYHGEMWGPQQLACRAGGAGLALRTPEEMGCRIHCGLSRPAKFTSAASRAAEFSWNCLRCRTGLRSGLAYRTATALDAPLLSSTDMACYSRPLAPPSSGKVTGQRVELCARGLDGRATRRAIAAGHAEKWGALSPTNLVP
jgi:hypothetical protein